MKLIEAMGILGDRMNDIGTTGMDPTMLEAWHCVRTYVTIKVGADIRAKEERGENGRKAGKKQEEVYAVTYSDPGTAPMVTIFGNREAAIEYSQYLVGRHDAVVLDECPVYTEFVGYVK